MPSLMETAGLVSLLRQPAEDSQVKAKSGNNGVFRLLKLIPMLTSGCKMAALLGRPKKVLLASTPAATITLFGCRKGRLTLAIQENPKSSLFFLIDLPLLTLTLHKEMASGVVKLALESETRTPRRRVTEEGLWTVYCNGRKSGYSVRRKELAEEDRRVMGLLRGVSMGAGVLPGSPEPEGEMTYMRARFERVVGSRDSEAFYMVSPDGGGGGPELSIFLVRVK